MDDSPEKDDDDETDRMALNMPGMRFTISGRNASRAFWAAGIIGIIIALGFAVPNILEAWNKQL